MQTMKQIKIYPEMKYKLTMPDTQVCQSAKIAGKQMYVRLIGSKFPVVELFRLDNTPFDRALTPIDAGLLLIDGSFYGTTE